MMEKYSKEFVEKLMNSFIFDSKTLKLSHDEKKYYANPIYQYLNPAKVTAEEFKSILENMKCK